MTEQPPEKAPAPPAGRQAPAQPGPEERAEKLRAELAEAEAAIPAAPGTVRLRVKPPHDSFTVAGVTVGSAPTSVPARAVARLTGAAAKAGVTLEEV